MPKNASPRTATESDLTVDIEGVEHLSRSVSLRLKVGIQPEGDIGPENLDPARGYLVKVYVYSEESGGWKQTKSLDEAFWFAKLRWIEDRNAGYIPDLDLDDDGGLL